MDLQGLISGFAGGFGQARQRSEDLNRLAQERQSEREAKVYTALLDSPDPEIQSLAATGLLHSSLAPNPKSGIRGWLGEMDQSPIMPRMLQLMQTPQTVPEVKQTLPSTQMTGMITTPPGAAPTALPETSPTEVGAPPPKPVESAMRVSQVPSVPYQTGGLTQVPRQTFRTPEQRAIQLARGKERGDVEGMKEGFLAAGIPEPEATDLVKKHYMQRALGGGAPYQSVAGELPDGTQAFGVFDRTTARYIDPSTGIPLEGFRPRTVGTGGSGVDRDALARANYGRPYAQLKPNEQQHVLDLELTRAGEKAGATTSGRGEAAAGIPLSTEQRFTATRGLQTDWRKIEAPHREMQRQLQLMQTGLQRYGQGDRIGGSQAVLVTFQKILDPTSVVRESEYERSPEGLSIKQRLQGMYDRYIGQYDPQTGRWVGGGAGVPQEELSAMTETARQFLDGMTTWNAAEQARINETAQRYGIDPALISGRPATTTPGQPPPAAPARPGASPAQTAAPIAPKMYQDANGRWIIQR